MDEGDGDIKNNIEGDFEEDLRCQDPSLVPLPLLFVRREIGHRFQRFTTNELEHWGEHFLVKSKHSQLNCQLPGTPKSTFLMVFSPDGSKVASTHGDHNIYITDVKTGKCICTLKGHPRTPWSVAFHPSSNEIVASGCLDGQVRVWDLKGGSEVWTPEKKHVIASLAFHPTDQVLVIATDNELYFWDWFCPEPFAKIATGSDREKVKYVKFDPLGYKLITGIANVRHTRHEANQTNSNVNNGSVSANSSRNITSAAPCVNRTSQSGWPNRPSRMMDWYRPPRFTTPNSGISSQDASNQPVNATDFNPSLRTDPHRARNFARIIRELNDRTRTQEPARTQASVIPDSNTSNIISENPWIPNYLPSSSRSSRDASAPFEEDMRLGEIRQPIRPISDDSGSSSSLDSSSSVASSLSGTSHERNTRLSLLWTSRLNRTGNESDNNSIVGGYDLEERRGEGTVMRGETSGTPDMPLNIPVDIGDSTVAPSNVDDEDDSGGDSDTRGASTSNGGVRSGSQGGRWMYYRGKFPWNIPHPRTRNSHLGVGTSDASSENNRSSSGRSTSRLMRSASNHSSRHQGDTQGLNSITAPGPSGISQRIPSSSGSQPLSDPLSQSSSRSTNSSLLDPHFGVQLLSRHIENMQRICRSLSLPRAHLELTRHRHEITRLQQIRSMLYDIQHQIRALRASVDQTISEEFSDVMPNESLNSINTALPTLESIRAELLNSSSVADQVELEVDIQEDLNQYSYSTLAEEDPDQLVPALIPRDSQSLSPTFEYNVISEALPASPFSRNPNGRILSRARQVSRLQRPSAATSRVRSRHNSRNRLVWPWLIRRLPHRRRPTRSRINLSSQANNLHPSVVVLNRTSVGLTRSRAARRISSDVRADRNARRGQIQSQGVDIASRQPRRASNDLPAPVTVSAIIPQVRRRHSGDWQRRLRSLVLADPLRVSFENSLSGSLNSSLNASAIDSGTFNNNSTNQPVIAIIPSGNSLSGCEQRPHVACNNSEPPHLLPNVSAMEESERSLLEIQAEVDQLSEVILNNTRPLLNSSHRSYYSERSSISDNNLDSRVLNDQSQSNLQNLNLNTLRSLNSNSNNTNSSDDDDVEMPERTTRAGPPTTSLSSRIAAMLSQQELSNRNPSSSSRNINNLPLLSNGGPIRNNSETETHSRSRESSSSHLRRARPYWPYSTGFHSPPPPPANPFFEEDEFLLRDRPSPDADDRPFLQSLRSLRREIMVSHRNRMLRRNTLVSGGDLAGATLAAINPNLESARDQLRENVRAERRERYRQMLQMMADRLNRLMNRSLLSQHLRENPTDNAESDLNNLGGRPSVRERTATGTGIGNSNPSSGTSQESIPSTSTNSASAAIDNHMRNLRLLVRLALHLIYQLLNFICNQNISYEERPISRLPNPFREEEDNSSNQRMDRNSNEVGAAPSSFDLDIEPGLHNLTTLLETVRMASEELRNDALSNGDLSSTRGATASPSVNQPFSARLPGINSGVRPGTNSEEGEASVAETPASFHGGEGPGSFHATSASSNVSANNYNPDRPTGSAVRRRLTNFLIRSGSYINGYDFLDPNQRIPSEATSGPIESQNPLIQRPLPTNPTPPRSTIPLGHFGVPPPSSPPLVIPQIVLNDLSEERPLDRPLLSQDPLDNLGPGPSNPMPNEELSFHLRSFGGIPLRFLGRQNAVDRRSPDSEDSTGASNTRREETGNAVPGPLNDRLNPNYSSIGRHPFRPWGQAPGFALPNQLPPESPFVDRGAERGDPDHFMYFSRPFFNQYMASRNISVSFYDPYSPLFAGASNPTHRIQAWDFNDFQIPDISDSFSNIVVQKCKIHFDASVSISDDGNMLAALIPENQPMTRVCVFSLEAKTLGQVLYSSIMDSNTICVSISPSMKHLVVGFASYHTRLSVHHNDKQLVASIYKLYDSPILKERHQAGKLIYIKPIELQRDHRLVSLNCIRWMPFPGQGLIYGTNRGQLTILR